MIFTSLCGKGNVNMAGLDEELEGVDYITQSEIDSNNDFFSTIGISDNSIKRLMLAGSRCNYDWQWTISKISMKNSTCEQVFNQLILMYYGVSYLNKCYDGAQYTINLDNYFTDMQNSRECSNVSIVFKSTTITGNFNFDFTNSGNPIHSKYLINSNIQNQGVVSGSGSQLESYIGFGPNTNAPLMLFSITQSTDQNFVTATNPKCNVK